MQKVMSDMKMDQDQLKAWTYERLCETTPVCVTFTKRDGTERKLLCTLNSKNIPVDKQPKEPEVAVEPGSQIAGPAIRVFDVEKQEWRSFRWESIISVTV